MWPLKLALLLAVPWVARAQKRDSSCQVVDMHGNKYDLTPLRLNTRNYVAINEAWDDTSAHIINVCGPLAPTNHTGCSPEAASCRYSIDKPDDADNMGIYMKNLSSVALSLVYPRGEKCTFNTTMNFSTRIQFRCDPHAGKGIPIAKPLIKQLCQQQYLWPTSVVCSMKEKDDSHINHHGKCIVEDTSYYVDRVVDLAYFRRTAKNIYQIPSRRYKGSNYTLNVCGAAASTWYGCSSAGVCLNRTSYGVTYKRGVQLHHRTLSMTYTDGYKCTDGDTLESRIDFICDRAAGHGLPVVKEELECLTTFEWRTTYVCPTIAPTCRLGSLDLSDLSSAIYDWYFTDNERNSYRLNLCGPLNNLLGVPGDTMALVQQTGTGKIQVLGKDWDQVYKLNPSMETVMEYGQGSEYCDGEERKASIEIHLKCHPVTLNPAFMSRGSRSKDCITKVEWKTPMACSYGHRPLPQIDNHVYDTVDGWALNLTSLYTRDYKIMGHLQSYKLGLAKDADCNGVCLKEVLYNVTYNVGSLDRLQYIVRARHFPLTVVMDSETPCKREPRVHHHVHITLLCEEDAHYENPPTYVYSSRFCGHYFEWRTPHVCKNNTRNMTAEDWELLKKKLNPSIPATTTLPGHTIAWMCVLGVLSVALISASAVALYIVISPEKRQALMARFSRAPPQDDNSALIFTDVLGERH